MARTLELEGVDKRYGGVQALRQASLSVQAGEVHGLLGPNGSGKSTLNKVMAGAVRPDRAVLRLDGQAVVIRGPRDAHRHRIESVYQQLSLIPHLTVAENLVLGVETSRAGLLRSSAEREAVDATLERFGDALGPHVRASTRVGSLHVGEQQLLEFAKVVLRRPQFLVLDEATASLHRDQVAVLFEVVRELTADGVGVVFVSHRMEEVLELCDRATIIRNGRNVATVPVRETTEHDLVQLMVGDLVQKAERTHRASVESTQPALVAEGLENEQLRGITFSAHPGEVVGLGGLQGQGQSDLLMTLFGARPLVGGSLTLQGRAMRPGTPRQAIRAGIALVPGDRASEGLYSQRSIQENLSTVTLPRRLRAGFIISMTDERRVARQQVEALHIKIGGLDDPVSTLSGGNAQKVVIGKWLPADPQIVLLDDPTKGVDVGAKSEIYSIIRSLTDQGVCVILNSSDDMELTELADRVLVMYEGQIVEELAGEAVTHDNLVAAALRVTSEGETKENL